MGAKGHQYLMELCLKCKQKKHSGQFNKKRGTKNGLRSWCKECEVIFKAKICTICDMEKPHSEYGYNMQGYDNLTHACKDCISKKQKANYKARLGDNYKPRNTKAVYNNVEKEERMCRGDCASIKPYKEFGVAKSNKGGVQTICRICSRLKARKGRGDGKKKFEGGLVTDTTHPWYSLDINDILSTKQIINARELTVKIDYKTTIYLPLGCNYKDRIKNFIDRTITKKNNVSSETVKL